MAYNNSNQMLPLNHSLLTANNIVQEFSQLPDRAEKELKNKKWQEYKKQDAGYKEIEKKLSDLRGLANTTKNQEAIKILIKS